ncbi:hypothetical protein MRX96_020687 [Rhipicephalus microplus]
MPVNEKGQSKSSDQPTWADKLKAPNGTRPPATNTPPAPDPRDQGAPGRACGDRTTVSFLFSGTSQLTLVSVSLLHARHPYARHFALHFVLQAFLESRPRGSFRTSRGPGSRVAVSPLSGETERPGHPAMRFGTRTVFAISQEG